MISIILCYVCVTAFSKVYSFSSVRDASWPKDMTSTFAYRTPSPIDISTCDTRLVNTSSQYQVVVSQYVPYSIVNTGCSVKLDFSPTELIYATGSILGKRKYLLEKIEFYWAKTHTGVAGSRIDGIGSPIIVEHVCRNSKYDNKTALFHRDGYLIIYFYVNVEGKNPNPYFTEFSNILSCLSKPCSISKTYTPTFYVWYDQWFKTSHFYAYPGSIGEYDCATVIQAPKSLSSYISIPQFQVFQNIKDSSGTPVRRVLPSHQAHGRPVIEVCGVHQSFPIV